MTPPTKLHIPFLLFSIIAAGCSSGPFATNAGESVLVEDATEFTVASLDGGFAYPGPQSAACDPGVWTYTVRLDTSQLLWDRCDVSGDATDPASYVPSSGSRVLPAADLGTARSAARMVHVSGLDNACGADKPTLQMSVTTPAGTQIYADDFYACLKQHDLYAVSEEIGRLGDHLRSLIQP